MNKRRIMIKARNYDLGLILSSVERRFIKEREVRERKASPLKEITLCTSILSEDKTIPFRVNICISFPILMQFLQLIPIFSEN